MLEGGASGLRVFGSDEDHGLLTSDRNTRPIGASRGGDKAIPETLFQIVSSSPSSVTVRVVCVFLRSHGHWRCWQVLKSSACT